MAFWIGAAVGALVGSIFTAVMVAALFRNAFDIYG